MTFWYYKNYIVEYESKKVIRGSKTFEEIIDEALDDNKTLTPQERTQIKQNHRNRPSRSR